MTEKMQPVDHDIVRKLTEEESAERPPFLIIEELPVKNFYLSAVHVSSSEYSILNHILRIWKQAGSVLILDRDCLDCSIQEHARHPSYWSSDFILETVNKLVEKNYLTDQNGWLIPEKPLLSCATDREVNTNEAWMCYTKTHYDIKISLRE